MSRPFTEADLKTLLYLMKGNKDALRLCLDIIDVGQLWDDLVDKDQGKISPDKISTAFIKAFRNIPMNPWFVSLPERSRWQLEGLLISAAIQYRDSTQLEMGNADDRFTAFIIRNAILALIHYVIGLVGGEDWLDENAQMFWKAFPLRTEYEKFLTEDQNAEI